MFGLVQEHATVGILTGLVGSQAPTGQAFSALFRLKK